MEEKWKSCKNVGMSWIRKYQLFLFDLDGLLVNTEEIHFQAYQRALLKRGIRLNWDFKKYCSYAHYTSEGVKERLYHEFPALGTIESSWNALYADKKAAMVDMLHEGAIHPMPGVENFLMILQNESVSRCVVTHSSDELVSVIRRKNPILNTIPNWITREHYTRPKPDPECYLKAIQTRAKADSNVIGFEDTPRGIEALLKTRASPVLISEIPYPEIPSFITKGALHFPSFQSIPLDVIR